VIYSEDFVWIHFPKTAGTKIETIFKIYFSNIYQDKINKIINPSSINHHDSIFDRVYKDPHFALGNKCLIVGMRRLPCWLKSRFLFEVNRSPNLKHDPGLLLYGNFLESNGFQNHADKYIEKWIPLKLRQEHSNIFYLRTEYFESDFKKIFGQFVDVNKVPSSELKEKINTTNSQKHVDEIISKNLNLIYKSCPLWAELELQIYGNLTKQ
jgi:hypothetical protein